ncbi:MAG: HAD family hydrolase, partial [Rhabdochlamydiaceae bacterium]
HRLMKRMGSRGSGIEKFSYNAIRLAMEELSVNVKKIYEQGLDISPEDRGRMLFELLEIKFEGEEAQQLYKEAGRTLSNSGYYSRYPNLNPEVKPALKELRESFPKLKIGLISNAARSTKTYWRMFRFFGIADYFDSLTISSEVGFLKPRKEIFKRSLESLNVKPRQALHVGDLFKADIVGATSSGMNAALYSGLWHKYAKYMNPGERIPEDFKLGDKRLLVKEISNLGETIDLVRQLA